MYRRPLVRPTSIVFLSDLVLSSVVSLDQEMLARFCNAGISRTLSNNNYKTQIRNVVRFCNAGVDSWTLSRPHWLSLCNGGLTGVIQSLTNGQKLQSRRERESKNSFLQFQEKKEKPEIPFASFEREKRIRKEYAQLSRGEREMDFLCSSFKKRKRKWKQYLRFREEKEKC